MWTEAQPVPDNVHNAQESVLQFSGPEMTKNEGYRGVSTSETETSFHTSNSIVLEIEDDTDREEDNKYARIRYPRCFCSWKCTVIVFSLIVLLSWLFYALNPFVCRPFSPSHLPIVPYIDSDMKNPQEPFLIALMGDSMVIDPEWQHYGLQQGIAQHFPDRTMTFTNLGRNGGRMRHVRYDIDFHIFNHSHYKTFPDAVIVSVDSDISDEDFDDVLDNAQHTNHVSLMQQYEHDLAYVLNTTLSHGKHIAVTSAGGVFGEGWFLLPQTSRFHQKNRALFEYSEAIRTLAGTYGVPYIDLTAIFRAEIPWYRQAYMGCVTRDGEHPNQHGADLMARAFASVIHEWLTIK